MFLSIFAILEHMKSLRLQKPHLLVVVGIPGSGKTFFASQFADTFSAPYIHYSDIQGTSDAALSDEDTARLAGILFSELVKTHQTIIIEGPGATKTERLALTREARLAGYETLFVWVQTEPVTAQVRAVQGVRGSTHATITPDAFDQATKRFTPLASTEQFVVISGKHTYATQAKAILKRLVNPELETRQAVVPTSSPDRVRSGRITIQ